MIKRKVFEEVGQLAPEFPNSFNDVDLCLKIKRAGYLNVWTPYAEAYHFESRSRGYNINMKRKKQLVIDTALFKERWEKELAAGDAYYNVNFSLEKSDYSYK
jgi:GT2 family glycosyltransferase